MSFAPTRSMSAGMSLGMNPATKWFAAHEARLIWRDFRSLMTGGKPRRTAVVFLIIATFLCAMHWGTAWVLQETLKSGVVLSKPVVLTLSGGLLMMFSLMFSQAIESVTRAYYARSDLDLILSSPAPAQKLFEVRTCILTVQTVLLSVLIAAPAINVMVWYDGVKWLSAYLVLVALGGVAAGCAVLMTLTLFRLVGPARARSVAQIVAAVVGAGFVIALQAFAILYGQGLSRFSLFSSSEALAFAPDVSSFVWLPALAVMGNISAVVVMLICAGAFLAAVVKYSARRFAFDVLATSSMVEKKKTAAAFRGFASKTSIYATLRRKEWKLLSRDPWLISQSLQQILYLVPPALLLWMNYGEGSGIFFVVIPVIVMAAGQLAGGLSWITISGEDAHELIDTAPVSMRTVLTAKVQAVLAVIILVLTPFALVLAAYSPRAAICMLVGAALASGCAVTIQLWFRSQMNRSMFRRRQVSSKAATIAEALVSILWAAGAGLAMLHWALISIPAVFVLIVMGVTYYVRPVREG